MIVMAGHDVVVLDEVVVVVMVIVIIVAILVLFSLNMDRTTAPGGSLRGGGIPQLMCGQGRGVPCYKENPG